MPRHPGYVVSVETKAKMAASCRVRRTYRNARVIALLHAGLSRAAVADRLWVSLGTVDRIVVAHKRAIANGPAEGDGWRTVHCSGVSLGDAP